MFTNLQDFLVLYLFILAESLTFSHFYTRLKPIMRDSFDREWIALVNSTKHHLSKATLDTLHTVIFLTL